MRINPMPSILSPRPRAQAAFGHGKGKCGHSGCDHDHGHDHHDHDHGPHGHDKPSDTSGNSSSRGATGSGEASPPPASTLGGGTVGRKPSPKPKSSWQRFRHWMKTNVVSTFLKDLWHSLTSDCRYVWRKLTRKSTRKGSPP